MFGNVISKWLFLEDMMLSATGTATNGIFQKTSTIYGLYFNPEQTFEYLDVAADVDIDSVLE